MVHNIIYTYDNLNRLSTVKKNGTVEATYTYDTNGNRASLTYANGVVTTYSYNLANWVTNLSNKNSDGETLSSYSYTYYTSGNQKSKTDNNGKVTSYIYDDLGRLKQESESNGTTIQYTYNASGNRFRMLVTGIESYNVFYTYDAANQLTKEAKTVDGVSTVTNYTYDANGNTLGIWAPDSIQVNTYDAFNRLVETNVNGNKTSYIYNTAGIRTAKSTDGIITAFLLDGENVVGEVECGEVTATYLRGANLISRETATAEQYYIFNAHGDVTGLVNNSQTVEKTYDYDAFGNEKNPSASDQNPFRYCGEYFDKETGTYYLRARYYDPSIGRFTQQDTHWNTANMIYGDNPNKINEREDALGLKAYTYAPSISSIMQSGNLYVYGINNPVTFIDDSGNSITLAAVGMFALKHLLVPVITQVVSDILTYAYDDSPDKEFEPSSFGTYAWACISSTFSFGTSNPLLKLATESIVSSLGGEIVYGFEATITGKEFHTVSEVRANVVVSLVGDVAVDKMFPLDEFLDEAIPGSTPKSQRKPSSSSYGSPDAIRDTVESAIKIVPQAYKSAISNAYNNNKNFTTVFNLRW